MEKKETTSISGKEVGEWIKKNGIEGAKTELREMAEEINAVMEKVSDIINRHPECVIFHGLTLELKVDAHAGDAVMHVLHVSMGVEKGRSDESDCDGKCSFGSGCKADDEKRKRFEELIDGLDPKEKMMLNLLAILGAKE